MKESVEIGPPARWGETSVSTGSEAGGTGRGWRRFGWFALGLAAVSGPGIYALYRYSLKTELYSYAVLIPFVIAFLVWRQRERLPTPSGGSLGGALLTGLLGAVALTAYWFQTSLGWKLSRNDQLSLLAFALISFLVAGGFAFLGARVLRGIALPVGLLLFLVPIPDAGVNALEIFFQYTSAEASNALLVMSRTPYFRDGLVFQLPGIAIQVAQECSGLRSSLVLFLLSLLAGHLFLETPWKKWVLALVFIPLGIIRNGFRIFVLAMLCVHVSPDMIHSAIHDRGGPLFFALSLVPFFVLLFFLRRSERGKLDPPGNPGEN